VCYSPHPVNDLTGSMLAAKREPHSVTKTPGWSTIRGPSAPRRTWSSR
jgi:hypothetical protein